MPDNHHHHDAGSVTFAVLTISSSRTLETDASGDALADAIESDGHEVAVRDLVADDERAIRQRVQGFVDREDIDAVVTTGGTGVTPDDVTPEAVTPLFARDLPGFGEQFRARSVEDVGPLAMISRASAGVADGVPVFCLPGSEQAAEFGATELVLPVVGHVVGLVTGGSISGDHGHSHDPDHGEEHGHSHSTQDDHSYELEHDHRDGEDDHGD